MPTTEPRTETAGDDPVPERTNAHRALRRVVAETERVNDKAAAFEEFRCAVSEVPVRSSRAPSRAASLQAPLETRSGDGPSGDGCARVLGIFESTVRPHSVEDVERPEPLARTVSEELGQGVACALLSDDRAGFTDALRDAVLSETEGRQAELNAMLKALAREEESVRCCVEIAEEVLESVPPLPDGAPLRLGFDELHGIHVSLSGAQESVEDRIEERQETLHATTNHGAAAGVRHTELVDYLYEDLPTDHPVLLTLTRLNRLCDERKHLVCDHLSRSV